MPQRRANPYADDRPRPGQTAQYHPGGAALAESGRRTGSLAGDPSVTQPSQRPEQARPAPPPSPFGGGPGEPTPSPMAEDLTIAPGFPIPDFPSPGDRPEAPLPRPPSPEGPVSPYPPGGGYQPRPPEPPLPPPLPPEIFPPGPPPGRSLPGGSVHTVSFNKEVWTELNGGCK